MNSVVWIRNLKTLFVSSALILALSPLGALAALKTQGSSPWVEGQARASKVRLISEVLSLGDSATELHLGLEFELDPDWHVYWKSPGEVGFPPRLNWGELADESIPELLFPIPQRLPTKSGGVAYGYSKNITYPILFKNLQELPETLGVTVDYLVCDIQCIPERAQLEIDIPKRQGISVESPYKRIIDTALSQVPRPAESMTYTATWDSADQLRLELAAGLNIQNLFIHSPTQKFKSDTTTRESDRVWRVKFPENVTGPIEVAVDTKNSSPLSLNLEAPPQSTTVSVSSISLWLALLFAFLGGLILNLMPCVLPVVILKTVSLLKLKAESRSEIKSSLLWTSAGVIVSFWILAFVMIVLKGLGQQIGWGFHFQSSGFVSFMALIIFIFALNLFGLYEFALSSSAQNSLARRSSSPFFEGAFATLMATPCSAPFLGTALSFALGSSNLVLILTFTAMGLGLATPYFLILIYPRSLNLFPKPGLWMDRMRRILAYSLFITVLWLLYILQQQAGPLAIVLSILSFLIVFILIREWKSPLRWLLVLALIVSTPLMLERLRLTEGAHGKMEHTDFSESLIQDRRRAGERLYIVVTADWCLTCKYNETVVMQSRWFREALDQQQIKVLIFDWTQRDEKIGAFLKRYNRVGIPFSMFASRESEVLLPELLSKSSVEEALKKFANK